MFLFLLITHPKLNLYGNPTRHILCCLELSGLSRYSTICVTIITSKIATSDRFNAAGLRKSFETRSCSSRFTPACIAVRQSLHCPITTSFIALMARSLRFTSANDLNLKCFEHNLKRTVISLPSTQRARFFALLSCHFLVVFNSKNHDIDNITSASFVSKLSHSEKIFAYKLQSKHKCFGF